MRSRSLFTLLLVSAVVLETARAGVLPEDRTDALYHSYDGGGVTINGPSVLFRKEFLKDFSFSANYYVDMVSSASIDVITTTGTLFPRRIPITFMNLVRVHAAPLAALVVVVVVTDR